MKFQVYFIILSFKVLFIEGNYFNLFSKTKQEIEEREKEENRKFNHNFILYSLNKVEINLFQNVIKNISLFYSNSKDITSFDFLVEEKNCPITTKLYTSNSCLFHIKPQLIDRTCLVKINNNRHNNDNVHDIENIKKNGILFEGDLLVENEIYLFLTNSIGFSLQSYNLHDPSKHYQIQSDSKSSSNLECDRIKLQDLNLRDMLLNYWLFQKPLIIEEFYSKKSRVEIDEILQAYKEVKLGTKLSFERDFEGFDDLKNWEMSKSQYVPFEILEQLESPELVVVRPFHEEMLLSEILRIWNNKYQLTSNLSSESEYQFPNMYVEYMPLHDTKLIEMTMKLLNLIELNESSLSNDILLKLSNLFPFVKYLLDGKGYLWLGDGSARGKLHFDPYDNLLIQVLLFTYLIYFFIVKYFVFVSFLFTKLG